MCSTTKLLISATKCLIPIAIYSKLFINCLKLCGIFYYIGTSGGACTGRFCGTPSLNTMTVFQASFNARASLTTYLCKMDWLLASNSQHGLHIFSAEIQKQAMSSHGWMGKLPGSSHLNKAADSMAWMGFKHDFFLENVFRKFFITASRILYF